MTQFERLATVRTTDGQIHLLAGDEYWTAVTKNRLATRDPGIKPTASDQEQSHVDR